MQKKKKRENILKTIINKPNGLLNKKIAEKDRAKK